MNHWYSTNMNTPVGAPDTVNARSLLLPYTGGLIAAMSITQAVIALTGGQIGTLALLLTAIVAIGIVVWLWHNYRKLLQVRFGMAIAHTVAFVVVTTSYNLHAAVRTITLGGTEGLQTAARELFTTPWFGATLIMSGFWGLGLLVHLTGAILGRGWED